METRWTAALSAALIFLLGACGGSSADPSGGDPYGTSSHIAGDDAFTYTESAEATNGTKASAEDTGYALDAKGIRISGALETGAVTQDVYRFNTSSFGYMDVRTFVEGAAQDEASSVLFLGLDAVADDGYSTLNGNGYFIHAWIQPNMDYAISVSPSASGASYTLEMRGDE